MRANSIILAGAAFLFISSLACMAEDGSSSLPPLGGQCEYKKYNGVAEIVSVKEKPGLTSSTR